MWDLGVISSSQTCVACGDSVSLCMEGRRRWPLGAAKIYTSPLGARRGLDEREADEFGMDNSHNDTPKVEGRRKFPRLSSAGF